MSKMTQIENNQEVFLTALLINNGNVVGFKTNKDSTFVNQDSKDTVTINREEYERVLAFLSKVESDENFYHEAAGIREMLETSV